MEKSIVQKSEIVSELPEVFFTDEIATVEDIDLNVLEFLAITELRNLANRLGVTEPMSKTQEEIIVEICKIVETELDYYNICE